MAVGRLSQSFALGNGISNNSVSDSGTNFNSFSREPEALNELRRQNTQLKKRVRICE